MFSSTLLIIALVAYCCCAGMLFLYGLNCYAMIWLFVRSRKEQLRKKHTLLERVERKMQADDWPVVTTQLPIYNEKFVIERLLKAVCAFDYPRDKHDIQLLDDSTDETAELSRRLVSDYQKQGFRITLLQRKDRAGYKAGALAYGMQVARGDLFAIFDADFLPPPDFLKKTVPFMIGDAKCGFVQTRWGHHNRGFSLLTMAQSIGIDGHFVVEQSARAWNDLYLNFNGTAGLWRRQAIEQAGGWQSDTITEDLDLSYRTQLEGWHGRYLFDVVVPAEIPTDINALKSQQYRWARGSIQTALKLLPAVLRQKNTRGFKKLQAILHLTHYMVHPIIVMMTLLVLPLLVWGQDVFRPFVIAPLLFLMLVSLVAPSTLYVFSQLVAYPDWKDKLRFIPGLTILGMGLAVNNTLGVAAAIFGRKGGVFVRTPKLGAMAVSGPKDKPSKTARVYLIRRNRSYWLEVFLGLWACAAFARFMFVSKFLVGPILLLHALGFLYVGVVSVVHDRRARRLRVWSISE